MSIPVIEIQTNAAKAIELARHFGPRLMTALPKALATGMEELTGAVIASAFVGTGVDTLGVRSGKLRASTGWRRVGNDGSLVASIGVVQGPATAYARIHETGDPPILPVKAKALAIPLKDALTPSGRPKFPGGPREAKKTHPDMFLMKRPGKPPMLVARMKITGGRRGRNGQTTPRKVERKLYFLFLLVARTKLPARHWLSAGVRKNTGVFQVAFNRRLASELGIAS
jgi:hypothetical protein